MDKKVSSGGVTFSGILTVLFIALKLTGYITWSWGWVLAPIWLPTLVMLGLITFYFIIGALIILITDLLGRLSK